MTLTELGAIGEFVGGVMVVVTLVYLAFQARHSIRMQRAAVPLSQADMNVTYADLIVADPEVARIWAEGLQDMNGLSPIDKVRFSTLMLKFWKFLEGQFWAQELGSIPAGFWKAQSSSAIAVYGLPGVQQYFSERRQVYSPEFVSFLDTGKTEFDATALRRESEQVSTSRKSET